MPDKKITIRDVARMCDVSTATVSRVVNNPEKVSPELRKRVQRAIEDSGFIPNQIAKQLSSKTSSSIAIFVYDITNPFFTRLIEELNRLAFDLGYSLLICDTENNKERELRYVEYVQSIQVAGLILTEGSFEGAITEVSDHVPIVAVDRARRPNDSYPLITSDNMDGAHKMVEYLINLNHRKIGFVGGPADMKTAADRKRGYLHAMKKHDLEVPDGYLFLGDFRSDSGVKAIEHYLSLEDPPTAIFCANDLMAQGVLARALSLGLAIPDDLSVAGFDGVLDTVFYRRLTTVRQSIEGLAKTTMEQMLNLIEKRPYKEESVIGVDLIPGETCKKWWGE